MVGDDAEVINGQIVIHGASSDVSHCPYMRRGGLQMSVDDDSPLGVGLYAGCVKVEAVGHCSAPCGKQQGIPFQEVGSAVGIVRIGQGHAVGSVVHG